MILAEVLQGFKLDKDFNTAKELLTKLVVEVHQLLNENMAAQNATKNQREPALTGRA